MGQQQLQCGQVVQVEHAVQRVGAGHACAGLQQQARALQAAQRVVQRLAIVRVGARIQQQPALRAIRRLQLHP